VVSSDRWDGTAVESTRYRAQLQKSSSISKVLYHDEKSLQPLMMSWFCGADLGGDGYELCSCVALIYFQTCHTSGTLVQSPLHRYSDGRGSDNEGTIGFEIVDKWNEVVGEEEPRVVGCAKLWHGTSRERVMTKHRPQG
jgi:hypothetical protein